MITAGIVALVTAGGGHASAPREMIEVYTLEFLISPKRGVCCVVIDDIIALINDTFLAWNRRPWLSPAADGGAARLLAPMREQPNYLY